MARFEQGHLGGNIIGGDPKGFYPMLWDYLIKQYRFKNVLDIGCGEGHSLNYFRFKNLATYGIDGAEYNIKKCIEMGHFGEIVDFTKQSFKNNFIFDFGWCCEVVEHVEEKFVNNIIETFKNCKLIAMTHALPNQGGYHHVNCKDWKYWVELLTANNFEFLEKDTKYARKYEPYYYFRKSGLIFKNNFFK